MTLRLRRRGVKRHGAVLVMALVALLVIMLMIATMMNGLIASHRQTQVNQDQLQAEWLAEASISRATAQLTSSSDYSGETWRAAVHDSDSEKDQGVAQISIKKAPDEPARINVLVEAHYPDHSWRRVLARREFTLMQRPAGSPPAAENPNEEK